MLFPAPSFSQMLSATNERTRMSLDLGVRHIKKNYFFPDSLLRISKGGRMVLYCTVR